MVGSSPIRYLSKESTVGDQVYQGPLERIGPFSWRIPKSYKPGMRVDGIIFADETLIDQIRLDRAPEQVANVATLPGIQKASLAMPDIHWGYGFCIGGVCATDPEEGGVISPGGVGYDINCGVRLIRTNLMYDEVQPQLEKLMSELFRDIPTGAGRGGRYQLDRSQTADVMVEGPKYLVEKLGLGCSRDIEFTESQGRLPGAKPDKVSDRAFMRGSDQCGSLGSGNHFLEVEVVDSIHDNLAAERLGLWSGQICILIHSGSRGIGHQVCTDYLSRFRSLPEKYGITLPDRQLVCAPVESPEGRDYLGAMSASANFAWANRHLIMVQARECFEHVFEKGWEDMAMHLIYDVAHNTAKLEEHEIDGQRKRVCVHRKGATRAFPAGHPELPSEYRDIGQPVFIPGSMGTASWVLVGMAGSMEQTFGSTCHGAGRRMSRQAAVRDTIARAPRGVGQSVSQFVAEELKAQGIVAKARSRRELAEEEPQAYKDVDRVVEIVHRAGLSKKVARLRAMGVIKG